MSFSHWLSGGGVRTTIEQPLDDDDDHDQAGSFLSQKDTVAEVSSPPAR